MLQTLATMRPHPESVPINILAKVPGTPHGDRPDVPIWETVRMIAAGAAADAGVGRASLGRAGEAVGQRSGPVLSGRGQFDFFQRQRADADRWRFPRRNTMRMRGCWGFWGCGR